MTETLPADTSLPRDTALLGEIARKTLWLSTAIVDAANRGRPNSSGVKVGGHQSSSASMVDIMTSLWFSELTRHDRVSVKPHASPVLHALNYLKWCRGGEFVPNPWPPVRFPGAPKAED